MPPEQGIAGARSTITLATILDQFREDARHNRDLGDRFERLMLRVFELDLLYKDRFSKVWLWNDWPGKGGVGDVGIDLVATELGRTCPTNFIGCRAIA